MALSLRFLSDFYGFWKVLEELSQNDQLKEKRIHYHKSFLSTCWNAFYSFYVVFLIISIVCCLLNRQFNVVFAPLTTLFCLIVIDLFAQIRFELIEYTFMIILIIEGLYITFEGSFYNEYRFHEIWLMFYCTFIIISISCCFHWKRMVLLYLIIQILYFIILHITYKNISVYFYPGYIFITILIPLVCMIIARIILAFLMLIHNNQELVKAIKKILQIFPEGILIQTLDKNSRKLIIQFVNDTATKEIVKYSNACGKPIIEENLKYELKTVYSSSNKENTFEENEANDITNLSALLESHVEKTQLNETEVASSIEICSDCINEMIEKCTYCKHYNVKTMQLKWGTNRYSFIHVFINTTAVKQIEEEKARNDCLQLMFSSVSHEFRTPLNAFSNSALLLESNYQMLLQKIDKLVPQELVPKLITQTQRESDERFYTICKISTASLMSLIEDILDLSKLEAGTFSLNEQPFLVKTLANDIENIFMFQCVQKNLTFKIDVENEVLTSMFCSDIGRIKQILMNLISNAFKFTLIGGITVSIQSKIDFNILSFERVRILKFTVSDTGMGIQTNEIPNLF